MIGSLLGNEVADLNERVGGSDRDKIGKLISVLPEIQKLTDDENFTKLMALSKVDIDKLYKTVNNLENMTVEAKAIPYGEKLTSKLENGVLKLGIPEGKRGKKPVVKIEFNKLTGDLDYRTEYIED